MCASSRGYLSAKFNYSAIYFGWKLTGNKAIKHSSLPPPYRGKALSVSLWSIGALRSPFSGQISSGTRNTRWLIHFWEIMKPCIIFSFRIQRSWNRNDWTTDVIVFIWLISKNGNLFFKALSIFLINILTNEKPTWTRWKDFFLLFCRNVCYIDTSWGTRRCLGYE